MSKVIMQTCCPVCMKTLPEAPTKCMGVWYCDLTCASLLSKALRAYQRDTFEKGFVKFVEGKNEIIDESEE